MNNEEKRIKIATACGWKDVYGSGSGQTGDEFDVRGIHPLFTALGRMSVPDYPNDLNAMYYAEKVLSFKEHTIYWGLLSQICCEADTDSRYATEPGHWRRLKAVSHASAEQRSSAFVITIEASKLI